MFGQVVAHVAQQFCLNNEGMRVERGPRGAPNLGNGKAEVVIGLMISREWNNMQTRLLFRLGIPYV